MIPKVDTELSDQLILERILPEEDVRKYEKLAETDHTDLATVLKSKRVLSDSQIHALRGLRMGVPYCNLSDYIPKLQNSDLLSEEIVRGHMVFPLFDFGDTITLVAEDPNDLAGIDRVRRHTRKEVDVVLGSRSEILGLIERAYGASQYLQQVSVADTLVDIGGDFAGDDAQPVIRLVDDLIGEAVRQGASDIHIEPGDRDLRVRIRVDGVLREVAAPPLGLHRGITSRIKVLSRLDISQTRAPQDGAFHHRSGDTEVIIRVSVLPSVFGEAVVMRILRNESESISLPDLGMSGGMLDEFHSLVKSPHGMILVSGPTGSGKSTTLYAAMKEIVSPQINIIAIEDPVEYRTSLIRQIQVNPEADLTFASGLRSVLRQDPDVVMVGEIRDSETAQISVQASLTGHVVLSTVHTNDSVSAVARMRDLGVAEYLISSSLLAVLAQRLCRRICPECGEPETPSPHLVKAVGLDPDNPGLQFMRGKGCRRCVGTGYLGRVGIFELYPISETYSRMITDCASTEALRAAAREDGMKFLVDDGVEKIREGITTVEEVARVAGRH